MPPVVAYIFVLGEWRGAGVGVMLPGDPKPDPASDSPSLVLVLVLGLSASLACNICGELWLGVSFFFCFGERDNS